MARRALVLGGTGVVGRAVVRQLALDPPPPAGGGSGWGAVSHTDPPPPAHINPPPPAGGGSGWGAVSHINPPPRASRGSGWGAVSTAFTYHRSRDMADALSAEYGCRAIELDLRDLDAVRAMFTALEESGESPDVLINCAAAGDPTALDDITDDAWTEISRINCHSALVASQQLARREHGERGADIVFVGALDRTQSLRLPVAFAATQGMLSAMAMALGKELGPRNIRVNMIALGLLGEGISTRLIPDLRDDFKAFSALRRVATSEEVAKAIVWLALENDYMTGKVVPVNGGI